MQTTCNEKYEKSPTVVVHLLFRGSQKLAIFWGFLAIFLRKTGLRNNERTELKMEVSNITYWFIHHVFEKVNVRDLGVHVDRFLKFDRHISLIVHKAVTRVRLILKFFFCQDRDITNRMTCAKYQTLNVPSPHRAAPKQKIKSNGLRE